MSDEKERPEHPRADAEVPRPRGRTQRTAKDFEMPIPSEDQFMSDLKKASQKKLTDTR